MDWNEIFRALILWALPAGASISLITFLLSHKPGWRNKLTGEFFITLERLESNVRDNEVLFVKVLIRITCRNSEPIKIIDAYLKFDDTGTGLDNYGRPVNGSQALPYWDHESKGIFTHSKTIKFTFMRANNFAQQSQDGGIKEIHVVVETNKYGMVSSGPYRVSDLISN